MIKNINEQQASLALRSLAGSDGNDIFTVAADALAGGVFDGAGGEDTLQLDGGSTFDLRLADVFKSIEIVRGSEGHDTIILDQELLLGVTTLDGGAQAAIHWDEVVLHGDAFDFRNITLIGIDQLSLKTNNAVIMVADVATALLVSGGESQNDRLVASNVALSASQLKLLHQRGIDTIVDANGTHTNVAPVTRGLNGDRFEAKAGQRVFVDMGRNVVVSDDDEFVALLKVNAPLGQAAPGRMGIDVTGSVTLDGGYASGSTIRVEGIDIGMLWDASDGGISVIFNNNASPDRVQELLRSLTYTMADVVPETSTQQHIVITLTDYGGRKSTSTVTIDQIVKVDAPQLTLSHASVPELSQGGKLIGLLTAKASGVGDAFTYKLLDSAGGRFAIDGDKLVVASGAGLDFENQKSHTIVVLASGPGNVTVRQTFVIDIEDVRDEYVINPGSTPTSSDGNDTLIGGRGRDTLTGGLGDDVLYGRESHDRLSGDKGKDIFVFDTQPSARTNVDRIADFKVKDDSIYLDNKVFKKLGLKGSLDHPAKLNAKMFWKGAKAHDADDRVIYNTKTGVLSYDPDRTGKSAAVKLAVLSKKLALSAKDFFVI